MEFYLASNQWLYFKYFLSTESSLNSLDTGLGSSLYMFSASTSPTNTSASALHDSNMSIQVESSSSGSSLNQFIQNVKENVIHNNNSTANLLSHMLGQNQKFPQQQQQQQSQHQPSQKQQRHCDYKKQSVNENFENSYSSELDGLDMASESTLVTDQTLTTVKNCLPINNNNNNDLEAKKYATTTATAITSGGGRQKSAYADTDCLSEVSSSTFADCDLNSIRTEEYSDVYHQYSQVPYLKLDETSNTYKH